MYLLPLRWFYRLLIRLLCKYVFCCWCRFVLPLPLIAVCFSSAWGLGLSPHVHHQSHVEVGEVDRARSFSYWSTYWSTFWKGVFWLVGKSLVVTWLFVKLEAEKIFGRVDDGVARLFRVPLLLLFWIVRLYYCFFGSFEKKLSEFSDWVRTWGMWTWDMLKRNRAINRGKVPYARGRTMKKNKNVDEAVVSR